jgi:hypothetical protein
VESFAIKDIQGQERKWRDLALLLAAHNPIRAMGHGFEKRETCCGESESVEGETGQF